MSADETPVHTPRIYRSTARFIGLVTTMLDRGDGLTLASLDFDHMGYFLKTYGSLRVERALEQCWQLLELRLAGLDAAVLRSSLDETEVAVTGVDATSLASILREHAGGVADAGALLFGTRQPRFGFTAVVAETPGVVTTDVDSGTRLRRLASSNQRSLEATKETLGRGAVRIVSPDEKSTGGAEAASMLWSSLDGDAAEHVRGSALSFREFESRAQAHPDSRILLVTPRFDGPSFLAAAHEGGRTLLPDGSSAGKLGYLNRVFGEHLTPNIVVERALNDLARSCPWPHNLSSAGSTLLLSTEADLSCASRCLIDWAKAARDETNLALGTVINVSHVQIALLPASHVRYAIDLAHRIYKLPCRLTHESSVFLHDCRGVAEDTLAAMLRRYEVEAAEEMTGAP